MERELEHPPTADPAEARVRALRDEVARASARLSEAGAVPLREVYDPLWQACGAIEEGDLGPDGAVIGTQFEALFERLRALMEQHPGPVPTNSLGLSADARFLKDMAEYLTRRYGLEDEE